MPDLNDTLDAIDRAVGCQQCGGTLGRSVSDDFCSQSCQEDWHAARSEPLVGYREPYDLPVHFSNQAELPLAEPAHPPLFPQPCTEDILSAHARAQAAFQQLIEYVDESIRFSAETMQPTFRRLAEAAHPLVQPTLSRDLDALPNTEARVIRLGIDPSFDLRSSTTAVWIQEPGGDRVEIGTLAEDVELTLDDPVAEMLERWRARRAQ